MFYSIMSVLGPLLIFPGKLHAIDISYNASKFYTPIDDSLFRGSWA